MATVDVTALPVELALTGTLTARLRDHVEGTLGWQVVDDPAFPSRVRLVGIEAARIGPRAGITVLVVDDGDGAAAVAEAVPHVDAIVAWPSQAARLGPMVEALVTESAPVSGSVAPLVVGGATGGVGTSTVTLALAGLRAWQGSPTLAVTRGALLVPAALDLDVAALAAPGCWDAATVVPGVPDLRAVRLAQPWTSPRDPGLRVGAVVDAGVHLDVDVLVVRRDRPGVEAIGESPAAVVVVLDAGVVPRRVVARAADGRTVIPVATSARVAAAHASRRLPAGLPGRWLAPLAPLVIAEG